MKKFIVSVVSLLAICVAIPSFAQTYRDSYGASGTAGASFVVPSANLRPVCQTWYSSIATAATVVVYRPDIASTHVGSLTNSTNVSVEVSTAGAASGYTITTNDHVIVATSSGEILRDILTMSGVLTNGSGTVYLNLNVTATGSGVVAADGAKVSIAKNAKKVSIPLAAGVLSAQYMYSGYSGYPVAVEAPSTAGATTINNLINFE